MDKIIALVSGLDSFCYLGQYVDKYKVEVLIFNYGQRAQKGIEQMTSLIDSLRPDHPLLTRRTLDIQFLKSAYPGFQQTGPLLYPKPDYDSSVVLPLRNTIFLTIAGAYAKNTGAIRILIGATIEDVGLPGIEKFPDLNPKYHRSLEALLEKGCLPQGDLPVEIWSPARQGMSKARNLKNGCQVFGEDLVCQTWSCFGESKRQCGRCFGCTERRRVFEQAGIVDKTEYEETN